MNALNGLAGGLKGHVNPKDTVSRYEAAFMETSVKTYERYTPHNYKLLDLPENKVLRVTTESGSLYTFYWYNNKLIASKGKDSWQFENLDFDIEVGKIIDYPGKIQTTNVSQISIIPTYSELFSENESEIDAICSDAIPKGVQISIYTSNSSRYNVQNTGNGVFVQKVYSDGRVSSRWFKFAEKTGIKHGSVLEYINANNPDDIGYTSSVTKVTSVKLKNKQ